MIGFILIYVPETFRRKIGFDKTTVYCQPPYAAKLTVPVPNIDTCMCDTCEPLFSTMFKMINCI